MWYCPICEKKFGGYPYDHWNACGLLKEYNNGICLCGANPDNAFAMMEHFGAVEHNWPALLVSRVLESM